MAHEREPTSPAHVRCNRRRLARVLADAVYWHGGVEVEVMVCVVHPCLPASHIRPDARPGLAAGTAQLGELSSRDDPARLVRAWARDAPAPVTTSADASVSSTTEIDGSARAWPADR